MRLLNIAKTWSSFFDGRSVFSYSAPKLCPTSLLPRTCPNLLVTRSEG